MAWTYSPNGGKYGVALHRHLYSIVVKQRRSCGRSVLHSRQMPFTKARMNLTTPPPGRALCAPSSRPTLPHFALCASLPLLLTPPCPVCDNHGTLLWSLSYKDAFHLLTVTTKNHPFSHTLHRLTHLPSI